MQGGILVTNDKEQTPVLVGNMDLTVSDGRLVSRNSSSVLTTSTLQTPGTITGKTPFEKLVALQNLVVRTWAPHVPLPCRAQPVPLCPTEHLFIYFGYPEGVHLPKYKHCGK